MEDSEVIEAVATTDLKVIVSECGCGCGCTAAENASEKDKREAATSN